MTKRIIFYLVLVLFVLGSEPNARCGSFEKEAEILKKDPNSKETISKLTSLCSDEDFDACNTLATSLLEHDKPEEAIPLLRTACDKKVSQSCVNLAVAYEESGSFDKAMNAAKSGCDYGHKKMCEMMPQYIASVSLKKRAAQNAKAEDRSQMKIEIMSGKHTKGITNTRTWGSSWGGIQNEGQYWGLYQLLNGYALFQYNDSPGLVSGNDFVIAVKGLKADQSKQNSSLAVVAECLRYIGDETWKNTSGFPLKVKTYKYSECPKAISKKTK